ncbi:MAG: hypothetical protein PVG25_09120 [Anaerolineae bacterium]|jgi:hypothetical protein
MDDPTNHNSIRCTATRADGSPCRAWSVRGTDPPRCAPHGGGRAPVGAPQGNQNARTHGFYARSDVQTEGWTIETLIADVSARHASLSRYVGQRLADDHADLKELTRLLTLYGKSTSRLRRLLEERHTQRAVSERLRAMIAQALQQAVGDPEVEQ